MMDNDYADLKEEVEGKSIPVTAVTFRGDDLGVHDKVEQFTKIDSYLFKLLKPLSGGLGVRVPSRAQLKENIREAFYALSFAFSLLVLLNLLIIQILTLKV